MAGEIGRKRYILMSLWSRHPDALKFFVINRCIFEQHFGSIKWYAQVDAVDHVVAGEVLKPMWWRKNDSRRQDDDCDDGG